MKKMMNTTAAVLLSLLAGTASAQVSGSKTGDIGSATGKSASCAVTTTRMDLKDVIAIGEYNTGELTLTAFAHDERLQGKIIVDIGGGYQVALTLTYSPESSIRDKDADTVLLTAYLMRINANGVKSVLTSQRSSSEQEVFVNTRKDILYAGASLDNPELLTVAANQKTPMSAYSLLQAGLIPDGLLNNLIISCSVRTGK